MQEVSTSSPQSFSLSPSLSDLVSSVSAFESSISVASVEPATASYTRLSIRVNSLCILRYHTSCFLSAVRPAGISPEGPNDPSGNLLKQLGWSSHATFLGFPFLLTQDAKWLLVVSSQFISHGLTAINSCLMFLAITRIRKPKGRNTYGSLTVDLRVNALLQRAQVYGANGLALGFGAAFEFMLL